MSEQFKIGDDVIIVNDFSTWLGYYDLPNDTVLHVVEKHSNDYHYVDGDDLLIEIEAVLRFPEDFQVVSRTKENVEIEVMIGDYVEVLVPLERFAKEQTIEVGTVLEVVEDKPGSWWVHGDTIELGALVNHRSKFKLVPAPKPNEYATGGWLNGDHQLGLIGEQCSDYVIPMTRIEKEETVRADGGTVIGKLNLPSGLSDETYKQFGEMLVKAHESKDSQILGVYRPELETRKVGKVPMHMVIDGFPRALREVAKVMGWAADVKGYKLHDWKNLPDADIEFPSAGNRHMIDNSIMKSEGTSAIERVDHESNLVHLAHEVFNKLAELELILTGKIK